MLLPAARWLVNETRSWTRYTHFLRHAPILSIEAINTGRGQALRYLDDLRVEDAPCGRYRYSGGNGSALLYASVFGQFLDAHGLQFQPLGELEDSYVKKQ